MHSLEESAAFKLSTTHDTLTLARDCMNETKEQHFHRVQTILYTAHFGSNVAVTPVEHMKNH